MSIPIERHTGENWRNMNEFSCLVVTPSPRGVTITARAEVNGEHEEIVIEFPTDGRFGTLNHLVECLVSAQSAARFMRKHNDRYVARNKRRKAQVESAAVEKLRAVSRSRMVDGHGIEQFLDEHDNEG